jgi:hypothetical protein
VRGKAVFILNEIGESAMAQSADWTGATKRALAGAAAVILVYGTTGNMSAWGRSTPASTRCRASRSATKTAPRVAS